MAQRVPGKVALITGGARGQGASHGELLAREGARVVLADVLDDEGAQLAQELAARDLDVRYTHLDVRSEVDWRAAIELTESTFGAVTVLVNNAGIGSAGPSGIADCALEDWQRVLDVNATGVFLGIRAVIAGMRSAGGGSIINTASDWAHTGGGPDRAAAYVSSKAAVLGLTRNAALTLAADGIRVNSISPATVATPMVGTLDALHQEMVARTPMKRPAESIEVSYAVLYLASDESSYTTGVDFLMDGGLHTV